MINRGKDKRREHVAQAVARACSEHRHRDLLVAKITTRNERRKVLQYALPGPRKPGRIA